MSYLKMFTLVAIAALLAVPALSSASQPDATDSAQSVERVAQGETGSVTGTITARRARNVPNTVVYIQEAPGEFPAPAEPALMDQRNQVFDPFVLPIVQGTTVQFLNNDNTGHNVFTPDGSGYNLGTWGQGETRDHLFDTLGVYTQLCELHPSMIAYVLVLQNTYFAVVGDDGTFTIPDVPAGDYTLAVWNERKEAESQNVAVTAGAETEVAFELR